MKSLNQKITDYKANIKLLKDSGLNLNWKDIDLSDLLLSELVTLSVGKNLIKINTKIDIARLVFHGISNRSKIKKSKLKSNCKVLVFVNEPNQWDNIEPVLKVMQGNGFDSHIVSTKKKIINGLSCDFSSFTYAFGYSFHLNPFGRLINNQIVRVIYNNLPRLTYLYHTFSKILSSPSYKYVLIGNDITTEGKLLAILAKMKNIKVGTIQHGSIDRINPLHGLSLADNFFVYGKKPCDELIYLGKKQEEIMIYGWPMQESFKQLLTDYIKKNELVPKADILVCLSGAGHSVSIDSHIKVISLVKQLQDEFKLILLVKLHPKDKIEYYNCLNKHDTFIYDNNELRKAGSSLIELFSKVKCTLTVASNAALESLLSETAVITLDITNNFNSINFIKDGLTSHARNYLELKEHYLKISNIKKDRFTSELRSKVEQYYFNFFADDYKPTQSIANSILKTCAE